MGVKTAEKQRREPEREGLVPNSNLEEWLGMKMELPEIRQGLVLASSAESGRARTVTCILSILCFAEFGGYCLPQLWWFSKAHWGFSGSANFPASVSGCFGSGLVMTEKGSRKLKLNK